MGFKYQNMNGCVLFTKDELEFIRELGVLRSSYWDKNVPGSRGNRTKRDKLKVKIKESLKELQGDYCIYCGMHFEIRGNAHRDHIAPKDDRYYPQFLFESLNLVLACPCCNGLDKKNNTNTITTLNDDYKQCQFTIVHPYFDDFRDHLLFIFDNKNNSALVQEKSQKGRATIDLFELDIPFMSISRAAYLIRENIQLNAEDNLKFNDVLSFRNQT